MPLGRRSLIFAFTTLILAAALPCPGGAARCDAPSALWPLLPAAPHAFVEYVPSRDANAVMRRMVACLPARHPALDGAFMDTRPPSTIQELALRMMVRPASSEGVRRVLLAVVPSGSFWNPIPKRVLIVQGTSLEAASAALDATLAPPPAPELMGTLPPADRAVLFHREIMPSDPSVIAITETADGEDAFRWKSRVPEAALAAIGGAFPDPAAGLLIYAEGRRLQIFCFPELLVLNNIDPERPVLSAGAVAAGGSVSSRGVVLKGNIPLGNCRFSAMLDGASASAEVDARGVVKTELHLLPDRFFPECYTIANMSSFEQFQGDLAAVRDLAAMTGVHLERTLLFSWDGSFKAVLDERHLECRMGVSDPQGMDVLLDRSVRWSGFFAERGVGGGVISRDGASGDYILSTGARLHRAEDALVLRRTARSGPVAMGIPDCRLSVSVREDGLSWELQAVRPEAVGLLFSRLDRLGEELALAIPQAKQPAFAALGLDIIADAQFKYGFLGMARVNGRASQRYLPDYGRLGGPHPHDEPAKTPAAWAEEREMDGEGSPLSWIPAPLCRARYPGGTPLAGTLYAPVAKIDDRAVNWSEEFAFAATSVGLDGLPAGVYFVREDGMIWFKAGAPVIPDSVPGDPGRAGWVRMLPVPGGDGPKAELPRPKGGA